MKGGRVPTNNELSLAIENLDLRRLLAQAGLDAAEQRVIERLQRVLVEELHHRAKNMLATVMAITSQSLRSAESLQHGREAIGNRLVALGRVHDLLLQTVWASAGLAEILRIAIEPFDSPSASRFIIQNPDIEVSAGAVLPLAMVLNELCTNALKYGALSNTQGCVHIVATVDAAREQFQLRWSETGGPAVATPSRRGFGTKLIEQSFAGQLNGDARITYAATGVVCVLDVPLASLKPPE